MRLPISGQYPDDWATIARMVKGAAGWRCIRCDHEHDPAAGRCLTVHHFDGDKANVERWNLMALCQACHLSVQSRVDPRTSLLFAPALWAMPYVAGAIDAGLCEPPPGQSLRQWINMYETLAMRPEIYAWSADAPWPGKSWPHWAPKDPIKYAILIEGYKQ